MSAAVIAITQFETADFTLTLQLRDLPNEMAVRRARGDAGSSISWIVGHLLCFRCYAIQACGREQPNPWEEKFDSQAPATDGTDYPDIAELASAWSELHARLAETLSTVTADQLAAEPAPPNPMGNETLRDALAFTAWHEAYHIGVIGTLRVQFGHRHTHELAMEAMAAGVEGHP